MLRIDYLNRRQEGVGVMCADKGERGCFEDDAELLAREVIIRMWWIGRGIVARSHEVVVKLADPNRNGKG